MASVLVDAFGQQKTAQIVSKGIIAAILGRVHEGVSSPPSSDEGSDSSAVATQHAFVAALPKVLPPLACW